MCDMCNWFVESISFAGPSPDLLYTQYSRQCPQFSGTNLRDFGVRAQDQGVRWLRVRSILVLIAILQHTMCVEWFLSWGAFVSTHFHGLLCLILFVIWWKCALCKMLGVFHTSTPNMLMMEQFGGHCWWMVVDAEVPLKLAHMHRHHRHTSIFTQGTLQFYTILLHCPNMKSMRMNRVYHDKLFDQHWMTSLQAAVIFWFFVFWVLRMLIIGL